jgi:transcription elongation factor GreA
MTMTLPALTTSGRAALTARRADLLVQRAEAIAECVPPSGPGDDADRSGNIDAVSRLADLDARIAALDLQLQAPESSTSTGKPHGTVELGSRVRVRFGPGEPSEEFLIGLVEQTSPDTDVITPASPLGQALLGAQPGDVVTYHAASGANLTATLVDTVA